MQRTVLWRWKEVEILIDLRRMAVAVVGHGEGDGRICDFTYLDARREEWRRRAMGKWQAESKELSV
jgi:hypothetical protein